MLKLVGGIYISNQAWKLYSKLYPYFININSQQLNKTYPTLKNYILVTGSTDGLGKEIAQKLYKDLGYNVILHGRDEIKLQNLKKELESYSNGQLVKTLNLNLSLKYSFDEFNQSLEQQKVNDLQIVGLVNNAGITNMEKFQFMKENEINEIQNVNLNASIFFIRHILNQDKYKHRFIINMSSFLAQNTYSHTSVYSASKAYIQKLLQNIQQETQDVEIFNITPYYISTKMLEALKKQQKIAQKYFSMVDKELTVDVGNTNYINLIIALCLISKGFKSKIMSLIKGKQKPQEYSKEEKISDLLIYFNLQLKMAFYGIGLDVQVQRINTNIRLQIANNQKFSITNLSNHFQQCDRNGNQRLEYEEFVNALQNFGLFLKVVDYQALFKFYDVNKDGSISFEEFMSGIRQPLSNRRFMLVIQAWDTYDKEGKGNLTVKELIEGYCSSLGQEQQQTQQEKLLQALGKTIEDSVSKDEFIHLYESVSLSITSDDAFIKQFENYWGIQEYAHASVSKEEVQEITKLIRQKLIQQTNGTQDEYLLRKLFNRFDTNKSGYLFLHQLQAMFLSLNICIDKKYLVSIFNTFDKNNSSAIEFEEFLAFINYNPYP